MRGGCRPNSVRESGGSHCRNLGNGKEGAEPMSRAPKRAEDLLQILRTDQVVPDLREYFDLAQDPPVYSGAGFDSLGGGGARQDLKDTITAADILAVQCL